MAIAPKRSAPTVGAVASFVKGQGVKLFPLLPTQPAPAPVAQSSYVVGADSVAFSVEAGQTITVTFPNLPTRSTANPRSIAQSGGSVAVSTLNLLHFALALSDVTGVFPKAAPLAVDVKRVRVPGPFLGGGTSYQVFQAVITGASGGGASGNVAANLTLLVAGSG